MVSPHDAADAREVDNGVSAIEENTMPTRLDMRRFAGEMGCRV